MKRRSRLGRRAIGIRVWGCSSRSWRPLAVRPQSGLNGLPLSSGMFILSLGQLAAAESAFAGFTTAYPEGDLPFGYWLSKIGCLEKRFRSCQGEASADRLRSRQDNRRPCSGKSAAYGHPTYQMGRVHEAVRSLFGGASRLPEHCYALPRRSRRRCKSAGTCCLVVKEKQVIDQRVAPPMKKVKLFLSRTLVCFWLLLLSPGAFAQEAAGETERGRGVAHHS